MGAPHVSDIGSFIKAAACGGGRLVAGGTGDATAVTGATIDRLGYGSAKVVLVSRAVLAQAATLALAVEYQESSNGSDWDTAVALQASTTVATGGSGGSTELDITTFDIDLSGKKRYIRVNYTPNLSAANTDTAEATCALVMGGADTLPAT